MQMGLRKKMMAAETNVRFTIFAKFVDENEEKDDFKRIRCIELMRKANAITLDYIWQRGSFTIHEGVATNTGSG